MKNQALFSLKDKREKIKVLSAAILLGTLRVNITHPLLRPVCKHPLLVKLFENHAVFFQKLSLHPLKLASKSLFLNFHTPFENLLKSTPLLSKASIRA